MITPRIAQAFGIAARMVASGFLLWLGGCGGGSGGGGTAPAAATSPTAAAQPAPTTTSTLTVVTPPLAPMSCVQCRKIVFTSSRDGNDELYSVNADGTGLTRLTNDPASDDFAAWSPDGRRLVFTSRRTADDAELVVMNADGSNVVRHALAQRSVSYPTWSADGTKIAYAAISSGSLNIWVIGAAGGTPELLFSAPGWEGHPAWSPDGAKIALVSDWFAYDFTYDVFLINSDGSGFAPLTDGNIFDHRDYLSPSWAPNGAKIAVTIREEIGTDKYVAYIGVMNRDGSNLKPLVAASPSSKSSWSPDGSMIAFTSANNNIAWVSADGSAQGTIVSNGWNASWQP